ncbi:MAG: hypothetical protein L7W43_06955, partial [Rubripirellula sp.]|nr:hypothetical protein [Rubripirellula sp.]
MINKNNPYQSAAVITNTVPLNEAQTHTHFKKKFLTTYVVSVCFSLGIPIAIGLAASISRSSMLAAIFWTIGLWFPVPCLIPCSIVAAYLRKTAWNVAWKWCIFYG